MKKSVKIILAVVVLLAAAAGGIFYLLRPTQVETDWTVKGDLTETLNMQGNIAPGRSAVVTAPVPGKVESVLYTRGRAVEGGAEVLVLDDSRYQQQLSDQIASLEKQKTAIYTQGNSSQSEVKLRQEQLIGQMEAAKQEYKLMFGENGTADTGIDTAKNHLNAAKSAYDSAVKANADALKKWEEENKKQDAETNPDADDPDAGVPEEEVPGPVIPEKPKLPYGDAELNALKTGIDNAKEAYENAKLVGSDTNKRYYQSMLNSYEAQFETLTENGNNGALTIQTMASELSLSINALKREQKQEPITAPFSGVVWEVLAEEGSYVAQGQPLLRIYEEGKKSIEAWLLTEDAVHYKEGDEVQVSLADGTVFTGKITFLSPIAEEKLSTLGIPENRVLAEIASDEIPREMGPGYQVNLAFSYPAAEDVLYIPVSALVGEGAKAHVYVAEEDKAEEVPVKTGIYSGGFVEITEGLKEGERVIVNPEDLGVKDGSRISY